MIHLVQITFEQIVKKHNAAFTSLCQCLLLKAIATFTHITGSLLTTTQNTFTWMASLLIVPAQHAPTWFGGSFAAALHPRDPRLKTKQSTLGAGFYLQQGAVLLLAS